jgi:hypothetical protein
MNHQTRDVPRSMVDFDLFLPGFVAGVPGPSGLIP